MREKCKCNDCGWEGYRAELLYKRLRRQTEFDPEEGIDMCPECRSVDWDYVPCFTSEAAE